jgi:hypothetical protein
MYSAPRRFEDGVPTVTGSSAMTIRRTVIESVNFDGRTIFPLTVNFGQSRSFAKVAAHFPA